LTSRAVVVVGMHRSGTSALARGLAALSVYLGDNFFDLAPDNPTGYWEDQALVEISQRVLEELQLKWDDTELIAPERFQHYRIRLLEFKAAYYFNEVFMSQPLWGFKDPRAIRLLPFWLGAISKCHAADSYVVAIRHPGSVAASLFRRQQIPFAKAQRLWLVHNVPFLRELRDKPLVVVDYDLLTEKPHEQLERIAHRLGLPAAEVLGSPEIERFTDDFLDVRLRHSVVSPDDFDTTTELARLTQTAYLLLRELATDQCEGGPTFWSAWETIAQRLEALSHTGD
jgi:O-antigen biosynthesis protein